MSTIRPTYRPFINICRQMSSESKVSNSSKVNKSKDKSSKSKGPQKKTSEKNKDLKEKSVESVKYSPQIDDGTYRATEYYKHNNWSFYDYMTIMKEYRLPVPSNKS